MLMAVFTLSSVDGVVHAVRFVLFVRTISMGDSPDLNWVTLSTRLLWMSMFLHSFVRMFPQQGKNELAIMIVLPSSRLSRTKFTTLGMFGWMLLRLYQPRVGLIY